MSEAAQDVVAERAESDRPNNPLLFAIVAITLVALIAVVAGVNELFKATMERELSNKVLEPPSTALRSLRATEQQRLSHYQWVNEKDGVLRIPLSRAKELTLNDYRAKRSRSEAPPADAAPMQPVE